MKAILKFDDGKTVELSQETTDRLRKELVKDDRQLKVDRFRAIKESYNFVRIALVISSDTVWNGECGGEKYQVMTNLLAINEVRRIIEGLRRMIGD